MIYTIKKVSIINIDTQCIKGIKVIYRYLTIYITWLYILLYYHRIIYNIIIYNIIIYIYIYRCFSKNLFQKTLLSLDFTGVGEVFIKKKHPTSSGIVLLKYPTSSGRVPFYTKVVWYSCLFGNILYLCLEQKNRQGRFTFQVGFKPF